MIVFDKREPRPREEAGLLMGVYRRSSMCAYRGMKQLRQIYRAFLLGFAVRIWQDVPLFIAGPKFEGHCGCRL